MTPSQVLLPKGFGYVEFESVADAEKACEHLNGVRIEICPRVNCISNTFQPISNRDPSTGWHCRRRRNGTANKY